MHLRHILQLNALQRAGDSSVDDEVSDGSEADEADEPLLPIEKQAKLLDKKR